MKGYLLINRIDAGHHGRLGEVTSRSVLMLSRSVLCPKHLGLKVNAGNVHHRAGHGLTRGLWGISSCAAVFGGARGRHVALGRPTAVCRLLSAHCDGV